MEKKMLILLTKSPYGCEEGRIRVSNTQAGDCVVFTQDSIYASSNPPPDLVELIHKKQAEGVKFFVSKPDCDARGVTPAHGFVQVGYPEIVDLIIDCPLSY